MTQIQIHRCAVFATFLFGAIAASAQVREQITVEAVDVPVYVFSHGKPVRNLTKDDFELFVNGKRQPIDYFEAVDFADAPPAAAAASAEKETPPPPVELRDRRLFLFLFDLNYNRAAALDRSRRAAVEMVNHALAGDLFAVATATTGNGIVFEIPFMHDRDAVRRAILQLSKSHAHDPLALSLTDAERATAQAWSPLVPGGGDAGRTSRIAKGEDPLPELLALVLPEEHAAEVSRANEWVRTVGELAQRLAELKGNKHVIVFSQGFHIRLDYLSEQFRAVSEMASAFQSSDVLLHTLDLTPMSTGAAGVNVMSGKSGPATIPASENQSLLWMSAKAGGEWVHWTNDLGPALDELSASYSTVYRLGFKPVNARKGHNDIEVKVSHLPPGARVSFRKGFSGAVASPAAPDALRLADIVQNDTPQSGTPPTLSVVDRRLSVLVPVPQLSRQFGAVEDAQLMLYVFDSKGVPVVSRQKTFTIPEHAATDSVIQQTLDLAPGKYVAKVLLRVGDSLAFAKEPFEIEASPSQ